DIMKIAGLGEENLPDLLGSSSMGGTTTRKASEHLHVQQGTPVVSGGHDQYCASLGVGARKKGDCMLSCGTAWVLLITGDRLVFLPGKGWTPGRYAAEGMFGLMASIGNAGIILEWMRNNIKIDRTADSMETKVVVVPDFSKGKGTVRNISLSTTGTEIYRAAMEALILRLKERLDEVENENPVKRLFMVGGATKEPFLPEMVRKITCKDLLMPDISEAAGKGAALLAINRI
ncbi:MAG TPA: FGGY-family carbohydrate kinase, partial [bacterium]|nr:FGGY-family carbohydrate kinase [bacterium]